MSMKWKIFIPVVCILVVLVIATLIFSSERFSRYTEILFNERISVASNGLKKYMADCENDSRIAALAAAADPKITSAVANRDKDEIINILSSSLDLYHVDFFTVTDADGIVLARTNAPDNYGDSVAYQNNIRDALYGNANTYIEEGTFVKLSTRTGAPVYDADGNLIGAISAGVRFDCNDTLDWLKEHYNADFWVFINSEMITGTIMVDGERITGIPLPAETAEVIYTTKQEVTGFDTVNGEDYSIFFLPLLDSQGEIFAVIATGCSNMQLLAERSSMQVNIFLIGLLGLASSILILLLITTRVIKPINHLSQLVKNVSDGCLEVDRPVETAVAKDEIGLLTSNIYRLVDVIKYILSDLAYLTSDLDKFSDIDIYVDENKYSGSYRKIIQSIKVLADSVSIMRKTMAVMDHLDTMISVVDSDRRLLYINRSMAEYHNMDRDCYIGQKCHKAVRDLDQPCKICQMDKLMQDKESYPYFDYDGMLDVETGRYIGGRAAVIRWVDNEYVFFNSIKDETVRIENQEKLREATTAAEAASVAKTTFLANMSHEIRTPLNSIIGFSELALENAVAPLAKEYLTMINENAELLLQIINDILDISKVESGNIEFETIPFDLRELLKMCKSMIMPKAVEKNIDLQFYAESSFGKVLLGDPTKLRQVLLNLLSNAVKFTATGSVKLSVTVISESDDDVILHFTVKDTGIGMTPEQIAKVFDPFTQADASMTRKYGGTGLGMAIVRNTLDLMGSRLDIDSEPGKGTSIGFELTLKTTEKRPEMTEMGNLADDLDKPSFEGDVLVCEDNRVNQRVIIDHLGRVGLNAVIAGNGQEGIDKIQERIDKGIKPFDLILMDIHMPVMDGTEATKKIIRMGTGTPVVAMTANIMSDDRDLYIEAGMADYVGKPFTSQELWRCLLRFLVPVGFTATTDKSEDDEDREFINKLKADFLTTNQNRFNEIVHALDSDDITLAHRLVHSLKSNAGLIGKTMLQKTAAETERMLKDGECRVTDAQLNILRIELYAVLDELSRNLNKLPSGPQPDEVRAIDADVMWKLLGELEPLLKSGKPQSRKMIGDIRAIPGSDEVVRRMEDYDFDAAAIALSDLIDALGGDKKNTA